MQRLPTMYTIIYGIGQGPHTIPFALLEAFINQNDYDTLFPLIANPESFFTTCEQEEINLRKNQKENYSNLYQRMVEAREKNKTSGDLSDVAYPGNISGLGWKNAMKYMVNQHPYATYHWRNKIDLNSSEGHAMISVKGTEKTAVNAYRCGELDDSLLRDCLDGMSEDQNQYLNQNAFNEYINKFIDAILNSQPKSYDMN